MANTVKRALLIEKERRNREHAALVEILRRILRPRDNGKVLEVGLQRALTLLGFRPSLADLIACMAEAWGAGFTRMSAEDRRRCFTGVELTHSYAPGSKAYAAVAKRWEAKLAAEGLPAEPEVRVPDWSRAPIDEAYFVRAKEYLWAHDWAEKEGVDYQIWQRHALEGATVRQIADEMGLDKSAVHRVISRHRARMGWRPT